MINQLLKKYKLLKIKYQFIIDVFNLFSVYFLFLILLVLSEMIFYHSSLIRYQFNLIVMALPIVFLSYIIIRSLINIKGINPNMSEENLAKELGDKTPKLSDRIINALQLSIRKFDTGTQKELSKIALDAMNRDLDEINLDDKISPISKNKIISFITITMGVIISIFTIPELQKSLNRIYNYNHYYAPPTPFQITSGNESKIEIPSGNDVLITYFVENNYPDRIKLFWLAGNKKDSLILSSTEGLYSHTITNINTDVKYWASFQNDSWISAWDSIGTSVNKIKVIKRPSIKDINFEITPPSYTGLNSKNINGNVAQISALKGSKITCSFLSNQQLKSAYLTINTLDTLQFDQIKSNFWEGTFDINKDYIAELTIENFKNLKNNPLLLYRLKAIHDLSPEIYKILPTDQSFEINNINNPIVLSFQINDDYGLEKSFIEYTIIKPDYIESDSSLTTKLIKIYPNQTTYSKEVYNWDISNYNLFPGDQIKFRIGCKDNSPEFNFAKTPYFYAILPSFDNLFEELESKEEEIQDMSYNIKDQVQDIQESIEDMKLDMLKATEVDWEHENKAEKAMDKMEDLFTEIEKMQEAIQKLEEQAEKGNLIDEELVEKFNQFQELLDSIMTPEILEALQKMQEALDNMDLEQMLEAVENFDYNLNQFEQQIDRFIEMFELALAEQKMEELVNALELLVEEESHIEDELKNGEDPNNLSSVQNRQNENFDNLQNKMNEAMKSVEKFSENAAESVRELLESELNKTTKENLQDAQKMLSQNSPNAMDKVSKSKQNLEQMLATAQAIQQEFQEESIEEMLTIFYSVIYSILKLSEYQEDLILSFKDIRSSNPKLKSLTIEQFVIGKQFSKFVEQLLILSTKTFHISPKVNKKIGYCKKTIDQVIINLEQKKVRTAINEQKNALGAMNEIALMLINSMNQMQSTQSAAGLQSYMEQLEKMSQGQSEVNMNTMQLGQMGMGSQQGMMERLQAQQEALKKQLSEMLNDLPGESPGGLSQAEKDMEKVLNDFKNNRITNETKERQQKILSRLLDSQKSLKERDYSNKRKSETGQEKSYSGPLDLPENLGNENLIYIDAMEEALNQNYSLEYEKMFRKYYRNLQNDENK